MNAQLKDRRVLKERMMIIRDIREKAKLSEKCRRKMRMSVLDFDNMMILMAAQSQLTKDINGMCRSIGL